MMKTIYFAVIFTFLLTAPVLQAAGQSSSSSSTTATIFDTTGFPQWAKDMRRWDIIAFGSFPFSIFMVTFFSDIFRWNDANGMDFSEAGRRYAPWPLKSAGAVEMTKEEYERTLWLAAGLSAAVAVTDLIIVLIKRNRERRRIEAIPSGNVIINKSPYGVPDEEESAATDDTDDAVDSDESDLE